MIEQASPLRFYASRAKAVIGLLVMMPLLAAGACMLFVTIDILPSTLTKGTIDPVTIFSQLVAIVTIGATLIAILGCLFPTRIAISTDGIAFTKLGIFRQKFEWAQLSEPYLTGEDLGQPRLGMDVHGLRKKVIFSPTDYGLDSNEMLKILGQAMQGRLANPDQLESGKVRNVGWKIGVIFITVIFGRALLAALAVRH